ncbi:MAG: hypothetical protein KF770_26435 [Anaerolineae bacterium]|nr:hypothetical protein [Anaerolineae bacterium]
MWRVRSRKFYSGANQYAYPSTFSYQHQRTDVYPNCYQHTDPAPYKYARTNANTHSYTDP